MTAAASSTCYHFCTSGAESRQLAEFERVSTSDGGRKLSPLTAAIVSPESRLSCVARASSPRVQGAYPPVSSARERRLNSQPGRLRHRFMRRGRFTARAHVSKHLARRTGAASSQTCSLAGHREFVELFLNPPVNLLTVKQRRGMSGSPSAPWRGAA